MDTNSISMAAASTIVLFEQDVIRFFDNIAVV